MNDEKITYRLPYLMLACFLLGATLEYAYMDKVMQYESVGYFANSCDMEFGAGQWQTERIDYYTWVCVEKTPPAPVVNYSVNLSEFPHTDIEGLNATNQD